MTRVYFTTDGADDVAVVVEEAMSHIVRLVGIASPTGMTDKVMEYCYQAIAPLGFNLRRTRRGGLVVGVPGVRPDVRVLAAHVDTLGAVVRAIAPNGRLKLSAVGGFPFNSVEGEYCKVHTLEGPFYTGTIVPRKGSRHVYHEVEQRTDETMEVRLDEVVHGAADVRELGIRVGDPVSFDARAVLLPSGYIKARHLDDKASVGVLLALLAAMSRDRWALPYAVEIVISGDEEVGYGGNTGFSNGAFEYLAVDMGAIGEGLDATEHVVSICAKDSSGPYDFELRRRLVRLAERFAVPHTIDVYPYYRSDASAAKQAGYDVATALVGPGIDCSHAHERTHRDAIAATLRLVALYVQSD